MLLCTDCKYLDYKYKHDIDLLCWSTTIMDNVKGDQELTDKYETLYSSVPTDDNEMNKLHSIINEGPVSQQLQGMVVTPAIIAQYVRQLKKAKETSDHLIYGGHRLHVLLSILFNVMLQHGYNAKDLILSSIISIPNDLKSYLSSSTNYRGTSLFNAIGKVFDYAILLISNTCFQTSDMQFGFKQQHATVMCSLLFYIMK